MKNKIFRVSRTQHYNNFPRYFTAKTFLGSLLSILLFLLGVIIFGFFWYCNLFSRSIILLKQIFAPKNSESTSQSKFRVPLWFSIVSVIFLFPLTLVIIFVAAICSLIKLSV